MAISQLADGLWGRFYATIAIYLVLMQLTTQSEAVEYISTTLKSVAKDLTLFLVSGGSSAKTAVAALQCLDNKLSKNITVMLADERYLPYNSPDSNAKILKDLGIVENCGKFIEILSPDNSSAKDVTGKYREQLARYMLDAKTMIALFGIGTDNHIAGILPDTVAARSKETLTVHYTTPIFERISIAPDVFGKITEGFIYAEGPDKESAIRAIEQEFDSISHPAQLIKRCASWHVLYNKEGI